MVRQYEHTSVLNYRWEQVAQAFWNRYPNPQSVHVLSEDTSHRHVSRCDGRLFSSRLLLKTNRLPRWACGLLSARSVALQERSVCDASARSLVTVTENLAQQHLMSVHERVEYSPHPDDGSRTLVRRSVRVASSLFGLGYAIQALGVERFKKNIINTQLGFEHVLQTMFPSVTAGAHETISAVNTMEGAKDRLRQTAKKATQLAKSHAGSMLVACAEKET